MLTLCGFLYVSCRARERASIWQFGHVPVDEEQAPTV